MSSMEILVDTAWYVAKHGGWRWLKVPAVGAAITEIVVVMAQIDWLQIAPALGLGITAVGSAIIGLWRYLKITQIELMERERRARELPLDKLDPDDLHSKGRMP